jgi:DNA-directed RNA polymerase delta subunit
MTDDLKDTILATIEASLDAQLRAVRRLRKGECDETKPTSKVRMSQVDMAYDVLKDTQTPIHIEDLLKRIQTCFDTQVDRESLVSSLVKKIRQGKRFVRTAPNTFTLRPEEYR